MNQPKPSRKPTYEQLVGALQFAISRLGSHSPGCRLGEFALCRCSNAVAVRRLDKIVKAAVPSYVTLLDILAERNARDQAKAARTVKP